MGDPAADSALSVTLAADIARRSAKTAAAG
jgi:hypothetical protein